MAKWQYWIVVGSPCCSPSSLILSCHDFKIMARDKMDKGQPFTGHDTMGYVATYLSYPSPRLPLLKSHATRWINNDKPNQNNEGTGEKEL